MCDTGLLRIDATACDEKDLGRSAFSGGAESGAISVDPSLAALVAAWPQLTDAQRGAILAIAAGASQES